MPTYLARCATCGTEQDFIARIANRDDTPLCCEAKTERVFVAPMVAAMGISDSFSIVSPIDGRPVYGRSEYLAHLKKHKVRPLSDMKGEAEHRMASIQAEHKARGRETVAKVVHTLGG
jgi:hypothetical protein